MTPRLLAGTAGVILVILGCTDSMRRRSDNEFYALLGAVIAVLAAVTP